ncbi:two-component sensor histidine kinase [Streptomyces sp. TS71-3]|nr:two-component sensor histidine kinase [Streptomyces sp. TS71-3]
MRVVGEIVGRFLPRSVGARTALAAAVAASFILAGTGWWASRQLYDQRIKATISLAEDQADTLTNQLYQGAAPSGFGKLPYEIVVSGRPASAGCSGDLAALGSDVRHVLPAPVAGRWDVWSLRTVHFPGSAAGGQGPLEGHTFQALTADVQAHDLGHAKAAAIGIRDNALLRIYVVITPFDAEAAVASATRILLLVGSAGVVFVAAVAYAAAKHALRPVEAIRARTASVTASDPRERVEVPPTQDEIAALAVTINATLDRLGQAAAQQRRFIADAAHELRSPLTTLLASLEVALTYPDQTDWPSAVGTAARQTRRLRSLTEDLLLLARLDARVPAGPDTIVDLRELATTLAGQVLPAERHLAIECDARETALVRGRPDELERLLRNLLDNAVHHAFDRVLLSVRAEDEGVVVAVGDDGPGIPSAAREHIFEPFARLEDDRSRVSGGTGLGLAIARDIAHAHHGTLTVADRTCGTCFLVRLPYAGEATSGDHV